MVVDQTQKANTHNLHKDWTQKKKTKTVVNYINNKMDCQDEVNQEIATFNAVAFLSFTLTFACVVVRMFCQVKWQQNPEEGSKVLFGFAGVKFLFGILLATVLMPTCPEDCDCNINTFYPAIVFFLSIYWALLAKRYLQLSRQASVENMDGPVDTQELV